MSLQGVWSECLRFLDQKPVVVENSAGRLSSDAGLLVVREFDEQLGLMANLFRLNLHALALNLLIRLRNELPDPPELQTHPNERRRPAPLPDAEAPHPPTGSELRRAHRRTARTENVSMGWITGTVCG